MYKRKTQYTLRNVVIILAVTMLLSFMGVSYAKWSEDIQINAGIKTGKIQPEFSGEYNFLTDRSEGVSFNSTKTQANLEELVLHRGEIINLNLYIINKGTLSIKSEGVTIEKDGIAIQIPDHEIEPKSDRPAKITLSIEALESGEFDFNTNPIKLVYKQSNISEGWEKELYIKGNIAVIAVEESPNAVEVENKEPEEDQEVKEVLAEVVNEKVGVEETQPDLEQTPEGIME